MDEDFLSVANDEIHACKMFEEQNPDDIRLYQLDSEPNVYWYPFPFFKPDDNALYGYYEIDQNGSKEEITDSRDSLLFTRIVEDPKDWYSSVTLIKYSNQMLSRTYYYYLEAYRSCMRIIL